MVCGDFVVSLGNESSWEALFPSTVPESTGDAFRNLVGRGPRPQPSPYLSHARFRHGPRAAAGKGSAGQELKRKPSSGPGSKPDRNLGCGEGSLPLHAACVPEIREGEEGVGGPSEIAPHPHEAGFAKGSWGHRPALP